MLDKIIDEFMQTGDLSRTRIAVALGVSIAIAVYIFFVYKKATKNSFYSKSFNISMSIISIVTTGLILAMQSSLTLSLGMVGALSIVRFRTAIKEPLDLLFLFWAIAEGVICAAEIYQLAIILCVVVTFALLFLDIFPVKKAPYLLIVNSADKTVDSAIEPLVKKHTQYYKVKSKNVTAAGIDLVIELRTNEEKTLMDELVAMSSLESVSLMSHDGETRF